MVLNRGKGKGPYPVFPDLTPYFCPHKNQNPNYMLTFFLFFVFVVVFLVVMLGTSVLRIIRALFFGGRGPDSAGNPYASGGTSAGGASDASSRSYSSRTFIEEDETVPHRKKVFADDEGEYVDYEEIR